MTKIINPDIYIYFSKWNTAYAADFGHWQRDQKLKSVTLT